MKIILLETIKELGEKDSIVEVKDNYARNFLIKKNKAVEANSKTLNDRKLRMANDEKVAEENLEAAKNIKLKLEEKDIDISIKIGANGHAFGSVTSQEVSDGIFETFNYKIDKRKVVIEEPIKTVGRYLVKVRLHPKVIANVNLVVKGK